MKTTCGLIFIISLGVLVGQLVESSQVPVVVEEEQSWNIKIVFPWGERKYDEELGRWYAKYKETGKEYFFDPTGFVIQPHPFWEREYMKKALRERTWVPCYSVEGQELRMGRFGNWGE